jgi:hypothetical protein
LTVAEKHLLLDRLRSLGPPEPHLTGPFGKAPSALGLRERRFEVYGRPTTLEAPIDWAQDPHESRSWRYQLHSLMWLKPILLAYAEADDRAALEAALEVVVDWITANGNGTAATAELAWYDMAVSHRALTIAYVLRACLSVDMIDRPGAHLLLGACNRHAAELADESKYSADHNHGLAQDEALYLLARQVPVLPAAAAWADLATRRLRQTLRTTISEREGGHLEHSTEYQFAIANMVDRIAETMPELEELPELLARLREHSAWHAMPNGRKAQLGDSDDRPAEGWAIGAAAAQRGMAAFLETGSAFVRDGDSYLASTAAYHSAAHKHADATGFVLVEEGELLLGDAGRWGYHEREPDRIYARSAFAHNVLTVDEQDFRWRQSEPYGSGLLAAAEERGWYAILAGNPLLAAQGVEHRRLLLYRPAETLVVIDEVKAEAEHDYARRFHFGPKIDVELDPEGVVVARGERVEARLFDPSATSEVELDRGRDEPSRLGWTYPSDRQRLPVWTVTLRSRAADATLVAVLRLGGSPRDSSPRSTLSSDS